MVDRICDNCMSRVPADADKCPKCGIRFQNTNPGGALPNGWVLGERYTIGRYMDIDGEGVTYSAIDSNTLQRVIIKEYMPVTLCATRDEVGAIVSKPGCEVLFKTTRMDFRDLYSSLLRIGNSEGLVQVLDVLEENNTAYAVIEKIEGPTLSEYLMKLSGPIEYGKVLALLRPVFLGIEAMHTANLIHRGICPDNIILESGGTAKLGGYATLALRQQGSELKPKLYPGYSAPEQYTASEFEGRYTDIYALGAVLYRMVTGDAPTAADARKMQDSLRAPRAVNKNIPSYLSAGIARALRVAPAERVQSVPDLRLILSGEGGPDARGPLGLSKQQLIVGAAALGTIVVLLLVILLVSALGKKEPASSVSSSSSQSASVEGKTVPDFTNKIYADVVKNKTYTDVFKFGPSTEEYHDTIEEGRIISQNIKAGTEWDEKTAIEFVVSKGKEKVELPNLVGRTRDEAVAELNRLNINHQIADVANDGNMKANTVTDMTPKAGTEVEPKTTNPVVTIYVAKEDKAIEVPNVVGLSHDDAVAQLRSAGLNNLKVEMVSNEAGAFAPSTVSKLSVEVRTKVNPDTLITIYLAQNIPMPPVIGNKVGEARSRLNNMAGLRGITIKEEVANPAHPTYEEGRIVSTSHDGQEIKNGDTIILYVQPRIEQPAAPSTD